jgi:hydroxymethylbilane synthase
MSSNNKNLSTLPPSGVRGPIRIGTRDSELALWQAHTVQKKLNDLGYKTEIIAVKSQGDIILDKPLYELGITGIFTKTLDIAMINGQVDIAVHSMKDVPTALPQGIVQAAVL